MLTKKEDLFSTVSPTTVVLKQDASKIPAAKKRMPTQVERYQIGKLLEEHLTPKDDNGIVAYKHGMNDDKVASLIGSHISPDTVRNMRQQVFGQLRHYVPSGQATTLDARIAKLEELFDQLSEEIGSALRV